MSIKDYALDDTDFCVNADACYDDVITLEAAGYNAYMLELTKKDVIAMAKHFNLSEEDLK